MKLFYILLVLLLVFTIPLSFALTSPSTLGTAPINEESIPFFQGEYIVTNSSTYDRSNLLDSHNPNKAIKHYEIYSILQDIDKAFFTIYQYGNTLATDLANLVLQVNLLSLNVNDNLSSINQLDSDVYYLMNDTFDIYESDPFKSLMRDVYKPQWVDLFDQMLIDNMLSGTATTNHRSNLLNGNSTMHEEMIPLFNYVTIQKNLAQTYYDDFFINYPDYDPTLEDLTQPDSISTPEYDRINFSYNHVNALLTDYSNREIALTAFNSTIPENMFVKGIGMMDTPWTP